MNPLSLSVSPVALRRLSSAIIGYINDIKDSSSDRAKCAIEASNLYALLTSVRYRVEEAAPTDPWFVQVRTLGTQGGALDQFKDALGLLAGRLSQSAGTISKVKTALLELGRCGA